MCHDPCGKKMYEIVKHILGANTKTEILEALQWRGRK
jgi:mannose/fructose-specific phosphotransferase system component IIA